MTDRPPAIEDPDDGGLVQTSVPRSCAVLFVDVSGSSRLYQRLGDAMALKRIRGCLSLIERVLEEHGGRRIKAIGDELMCAFETPKQALLGAETMQLAVEEDNLDHDPKLSIRIGCHVGRVIESFGDLFGDTVNVAARVVQVARAGQIITTQTMVEQLDETLRQRIRPLGEVNVKGRNEAIAVLEYIWRQGDLTFANVPFVPPPEVPRIERLKLTFAGRHAWLARGHGTARLGRAVECEVMINDGAASRQHATIEARGDRFVIMDHSSNGTYVAWDGMDETLLRREELILPARGRIALGVSTTAKEATVIEFARES